MKTQTDW